MTKYIFVTGGVVSSVGKGITAASIGKILKTRNIAVTIQKLDPYINVDCGTMSPYQHGEVFVTQDGAETDLDLGHYERFIDENLTAASSVTTGQIYSSIIAQERRGQFLGGTIQVVPHVTNEIKRRFREVAEQSGASVVIVEVGGTVGDIEGLPFLEAIRQMRRDMGRENVLYVHVALLPFLSSTQELKTKPTQHSVNELRRIGVQPDVIVCRSDQPITEDIRDKIALFCDVDRRAVVPLPTLPITYETPLVLEEAGLGDLIVDMLHLPYRSSDLREWRELVDHMKELTDPVYIGIVGKYVELHDSYISVCEALRHAAVYFDRCLDLRWIPSELVEQDGVDALRQVQGVIVPGGFGVRGIEGMVIAARYCRENQIPYLGLCLGMQVMVIEYARHVLNSSQANSTEFDETTPCPVIDLVPDQRGLEDKGGTMRLGAYPCHLLEGSRAARVYGGGVVFERHRHRFEFNNDYREALEKAGMVFSGVSPDGRLVEITEIGDHPFMMGTQFHPEFHSRPGHPHPLFRELVRVAKEALLEGDQRPLPL